VTRFSAAHDAGRCAGTSLMLCASAHASDSVAPLPLSHSQGESVAVSGRLRNRIRSGGACSGRWGRDLTY